MSVPLDLATLYSLLGTKVPIELFDTVASTNDYLLAQKNLTPAVCIAEHQSKGRGQLGRPWHSPRGENIYLSYACVLPKPMGELGHLSMQVGEIVCDVLTQLGIKEGLTVKWPNDVLHDGKKLAGILIEVQSVANGHSRVIIGIGVNANMLVAADNFISQPWTSMRAIMGNNVDRNNIIAMLVRELTNLIRK